MAQLTMYAAKLGSPQTTLAATLAADATSMVLTDASVLPAGPNIAVLGVDENCEIVKYTAIDSATNTVSGLIRGQGGSTARVWETGSVVARNATSLDHDIFKANIEDLEANKSNTDHVHDDRYYTESEMDTKLAAKQNSLTFDSAPTSGSNNPVKSSGIKTALDGKVDLANGVLYFAGKATSVTSSAAVFCTISDSRITAKHVVTEIYYSNSSAVTSAVSWSTSAGKLTLSGINTNASNTVTVTLALAGNL